MKIGDLFDKFLLLLLISTLPLGIYFASKAPKTEITTQKTTTTTTQTQPEVQPNAKIKISQVFHDQEKNQLIINGKAPVANLNVVALATPTLKTKEDLASASDGKESSESAKKEATVAALKKDDNVLGQNVEVKAVKAGQDGEFIFIYEIKNDNLDQIEIRFDQLEATATIQYDFESESRTL